MYSIPVRNDTKYDIASVTKVLGTTFAIMNILSSSFKLDDLVDKYIPNYDTSKKGSTTLKNLLLHNSGLAYDYPEPLPDNQTDVIESISYSKPLFPIGT